MNHDYRGRHGRHPDRKSDARADGAHEPPVRHRHGGRGGHGGYGAGKRFFERGEFKFALLELLASEPMHGYQMIKAMEEKTGGLYTPSAGSIYPNLQLLEDMNLLASSEADGKKLYRITEEGAATLRERAGAQDGAERSGDVWERYGGRHHRHYGGKHGKHGHGRGGKHELRSLMKDWPDVIWMMAQVSGTAKATPDSKQAEQFRSLMEMLAAGLQDILDSIPAANAEASPASAAQTDADQGSDRTES